LLFSVVVSVASSEGGRKRNGIKYVGETVTVPNARTLTILHSPISCLAAPSHESSEVTSLMHRINDRPFEYAVRSLPLSVSQDVT